MPPVLPPPTVDAIVVYAPRLAPLAGEAAFDSVQIGEDVLRITPRLDDALKRSPGVSLFRRTSSEGANPTTQGLSLRSIAPSGAGRALVTLDGAPQNDPFGGWVIWSALPSEGLSGANIIRGAGAGPYGAGALTGVVALQERPATGGLAALDISAAQREGYRAAIVGGGPGVLITAAGESSAGYTPVRGAARGAADQPLQLQTYSFAFRAQRAFGGVQAAARLGTFEERRGAGLVGARSIASGASAAVTLAKPAAEGAGGWRAQAWVRGSDLANSSVAVAAGRATTTPANDQYATPAVGYGFNAALQGVHGVLSWEAGADARWTEGEARERFRLMNGGFTRGREAGGRTQVAGVYFEGSAEQGPWLLTGGARVDAWESSHAVRREWDLATNLFILDQTSPDASGTTPTARAGLRYDLGGDMWLRTAAYAGFRPPTLNELHRPFRVGNDITEANPGLKPEKLQGIEAGIGGGTGGALRWSSTLFYNRIQDPIANVTVGVGPGTFPTAGFVPAGGVLRQRQNAGEIKAWGLEGEASGELAATLAWQAAFAATRAEVDGGASAPQLTGKRPAQTPELTVTAGLDWRPASRLTLAADLRFESERYEDDLNSRKLAAGVQLDLRAGWRLNARQEIYIAAENLTDERLEVGETADGVESYAAPRTVRIGFAIRG
ncbi:TonB-dependent receptor [Phenylobacterium deserti]|uniref:TonB-dependent receptor n=1 Tax=Phenylobacterium deserti TaxID=1914756 RepID=A0A328A865_9CAUL|nr:TonB-dependent receptor [Phenylobacterium deserti]RAK50691.1 TonB-dependent receptor [Phenylobacterium deserti]